VQEQDQDKHQLEEAQHQDKVLDQDLDQHKVETQVLKEQVLEVEVPL
jgi:hypothetical protein